MITDIVDIISNSSIGLNMIPCSRYSPKILLLGLFWLEKNGITVIIIFLSIIIDIREEERNRDSQSNKTERDKIQPQKRKEKEYKFKNRT